MQPIPAGEFKAKCLKLLDQVAASQEELIVTKRGIPVVKIIPLDKPHSPFGFLKGTVIFKDDIVHYQLEEKWEVDTL